MAENSSTTSHIIKNITIGVISSVLAAALIYFFLNNPVKEEFKKKKEATVRAWNSYKQNKKIFSDVLGKMASTEDIELTRKNVNHEIDATVINMQNIKNESNADQRVMSSIDITVAQMNELKPLMNKYFDDILDFAKKNPTEEEGVAFMLTTATTFKNQVGTLKSRDSLRLVTIENDLIKEYGVDPKY